ncbi:TauD/TfdA family dioxygenase [Aerosakkonemataceae cyanobacterium BLCC-F154]|uniref:TauD/TfdA family dioxygenase n=1 Tax=Floridaenema fluviatile BLCC-F154 TaxID=3153640 RepID=A0ABV4YLA9_9CYAN
MQITSFRKTTNLNCSSPDALIKILPEVVNQVEKKGFSVFSAWDTEADTVQKIARQFGKIMRHIRADESGITTVAQGKSWHQNSNSSQNSPIEKNEYQSYDADEVIAHTDGTFIDGMNIIDGQIVRVEPPYVVLFQCVAPAEQGGELILIDTQQVLSDMLVENAQLAKILLTPGCISFCRDDQIALDFPVFQQRFDGSLRVRINCDNKAFTPDWSYEAVKRLYEEYFKNPKYRVALKLESKDVLVIDNYRVLHGRAVYQVYNNNNIRHHRRIWVANEPPNLVKNLQEEVKMKRAFETYNSYRITSPLLEEVPFKIKGGIRLKAESEKLLPGILHDLNISGSKER